jgi:hypothetical protein
MNPKGAVTGHDGQASYEWKAGMTRRRTHLKLGFEQVPHPPKHAGVVQLMDGSLIGGPFFYALRGRADISRYIVNL